jgi:hypothetical protein
MRKSSIIITLAVLGVLFSTCGSAFATVSTGTQTFFGSNEVTFNPVPSNVFDLDHSYAYAWGIDYQLAANTFVDTATISFNQINNWQLEPDANVLYINLLQSATNGVTTYWDGEASGNYFGSTVGAQLLTQYVDNNTAFENFSYSFNAGQLSALNAALANGNVGIGFDPDCHYYNSGVSLNIKTRVVPEPISCVLFVVGSGVLGAAVRKRRQV